MTLREELESISRSAWGPVHTLEEAELPDLPRRLTEALDAGELTLDGLSFKLLDVMQWLAEQEPLEVAPSFFSSRITDENAGVARFSAILLARYPVEALVTLRELASTGDRKTAEFTLVLAANLLKAGHRHAELRALRPALGKLAGMLRGQARDAATQTIALIDAIPPTPTGGEPPPAPSPASCDHREMELDPGTIEELVLAGSFDALDRVLGSTSSGARVPLRKAGKGAPMPALRWRSGAAVSVKAQRAYLAILRDLDLSSLLTSALEDGSVFELGVWLLADPKAHKKEHWVLPPCDRLACELGRADAAGLLSGRAYRYELFSPAMRRWSFRWWTEAEGQTRADLEGHFERARIQPLTRLAQFFPTPEQVASEGVASEAWWRAWLIEATEDALVGQRATPMHAFRRLILANPLAAGSLRGVVFHVEEHGYAWIDTEGRLVNDTGELRPEGHLAVLVAHPAIHGAPWPTEALVGAKSPFTQRRRPTYHETDLPDLPTLPPIPNATWRRRCRISGYLEHTETGGGTVEAMRRVAPNLAFVLHHAGYGGGYGGARPVTLKRAQIEGAGAHVAAWSEFIHDLRRLAGVDPPPADKPPAERPPPPEVLTAAFWQKPVDRCN